MEYSIHFPLQGAVIACDIVFEACAGKIELENNFFLYSLLFQLLQKMQPNPEATPDSSQVEVIGGGTGVGTDVERGLGSNDVTPSVDEAGSKRTTGEDAENLQTKGFELESSDDTGTKKGTIEDSTGECNQIFHSRKMIQAEGFF